MLIYSFNLDLISCAAVRFLSYLLRESPEYFFGKTSYESKINQPRIVIVGTDFTNYDFTILLPIYDFNLHWNGIGTSCNCLKTAFWGASYVRTNKREVRRGVTNWQRYKLKVIFEMVPKDWHQSTFSKKTNFSPLHGDYLSIKILLRYMIL